VLHKLASFKKNFMRTLTKIASLSALAAMALSARSQGVYSLNAVGYINLQIYAGNNLIANQLSDTPDNTLDTIFANGGVLAGSTFSEWDPSANQLMPSSVFNGTSWSINYSLSPNGVGGVLNSPAYTEVTLIGNVVNVNLNSTLPDAYTFTPPAQGPGTYLLAMAAPLTGTFDQIVGSDPIAGDSVETLDAATQTYTTTTFNGTSWNNGVPSLAVDQAAYFNLAVAEPSTLALTALGAGILLICQRKSA
jgi:hypothetical protein